MNFCSMTGAFFYCILLDFKRSIPVGNTNIVNITNIIFPCFNSVTVCKAQHTMSTNAIILATTKGRNTSFKFI